MTQPKRTADKESIFRQYGRTKNGAPVPQMVIVRDHWRHVHHVGWLIKRLRGSLELRVEDREEIANALQRCLAGESFENVFGIVRAPHRPKLNRTYYQAVEYLLRRRLGESAALARSAVASRWGTDRRPLSADTVKRAVSKYRGGAEKWIRKFVTDHKQRMLKMEPTLANRDTAYRSMILMVDQEMDPRDKEYLAAVMEWK